jgi:nitrile hydratase subunit alpha
MSGTHAGDQHQGTESDAALRTRALESLLIEKGLITTDVIDAVIRTYEQDVGPLNGAKVVARAWVDPAYKQRLLANGTAAVAELGFSGSQGAEIVVLENTPTVLLARSGWAKQNSPPW